MKAIVLRETGGPEVLKYEDVDDPVAGPGEVVVDVHAVSVNRTLDCIVRAGGYARPIQFPHVLGVDPAGIVSAVGAGVTHRKVGDRVFVDVQVRDEDLDINTIENLGAFRLLGVSMWGGYAEKCVVPAHVTHIVPAGLGFPEAVAIARHAPTAMNLLERRAGVRQGDWVLVMGAAGGLGIAGVQVARLNGARVIAAAGAPARVQVGLDLGADAGIDYAREDLTGRVMEITDGHGADIVFENVGNPEQFPKALATIAQRGRLVTAGAYGGSGDVAVNMRFLYLRQGTILGDPLQSPADIDRTLELAAGGRLEAVIDRIYPLAEAADAQRRVEAREGIGKVIIAPAGG